MNKKRFGVVSYNIHCNFTNYGSALQSWALCTVIDKLGKGKYESVLVDYCPDILKDKDPLNPMKNMWDKDSESHRQCELSLPAIRVNYEKFEDFYTNRFRRTEKVYTRENFEDIVSDENLDGFVCGADTIFCVDEFGIDDGYYSNYPCMKNGYSFSYAASFGDPHFTEETYALLNERLQNFNAISIRENLMLSYVQEHTDVPAQRVLDPTLLLSREDYDEIACERLIEKPYLLMYARRYNPKMEAYAEKYAEEHGLELIEISLRATNSEKHRMFYEAGVEEFLSLVKYADFVVTNSYHGMIASMLYETDFVVFSREQCDCKISELNEVTGLGGRILINGDEPLSDSIDFHAAFGRMEKLKQSSLKYLTTCLENSEPEEK